MMDTAFLIDFGMTASAAECLITFDGFQSTKSHKFGKTPTRLIYGENQEVIAWGSDVKQFNNIADLFKANLDLPRATREIETEKWTSDFLHLFCNHVLQEVLQKEGVKKENVRATWYLTTPGCWEESSRHDFKRLAYGVLTDILPGCDVFTDITESTAGCEFLVDYFELSPGTRAITCDIGGATCDAALAIMKLPEKDAAVFEIWPIDNELSSKVGVLNIDKALYENLIQFRANANKESENLIRSILDSREWQDARHAFDGSKDVILTLGPDFVQNNPGGLLKIDGTKLIIPRKAMELLFKDFINDLFSLIDASFKRVQSTLPRNETEISTIALCGGGGTMALPLKTLKNVYDKLEIKCPSSPEESRLATIIGHRIYRKRLLLDQYFGNICMGISSDTSRAKDNTIEWATLPGRLILFDCEFSATTEKAVHYFIVSKKSCGVADTTTLASLQKMSASGSDVLIWVLEVTRNLYWFHKQRYHIEVEWKAKDDFHFKAYNRKKSSTEFNLVSYRYSHAE